MKKQKYKNIVNYLNKILLSDPPLSRIAKMSLISTVLYVEFEKWIFCGFYILKNSGLLEIGPHQGKVIPCTHIQIGKGVCGTSAMKNKTIVVNDVSKYPNYISCDFKTKSEIVVPVRKNNDLKAVLDIDSDQPAFFTTQGADYLDRLMRELFTSNKC